MQSASCKLKDEGRAPAALVALLALAAVLLAPAAGYAQKFKRTTITDLRIGMQAGMLANETGKEYLFKPGFWAPVSVDIIVGDEPLPAGQLSVESADPEDIENVYTVNLPVLNPGQPITVQTYIKVGSRTGEVITRVTNKGTEVATKKSNFDAMNAEDLLFVAIGAPLPGLRQTLVDEYKKNNDNNNNNFNRTSTQGFVARLETVGSMPRNWFGYQGADMVLLTTSNADFVKEMINEKRHQALMEWVARGGKLVISAGRNPD